MQKSASQFIERISLHLEAYGLSRIAGRMLGYFLINGKSHSLDELADCLQVSKGTASTNARLLERRGMLERCSRPGDRRDFYCLSDNPWRDMFEVARRRMQGMRDIFEESARALPAEQEQACGRLKKWGDFYAFMLTDMDRRMERWEECRRSASAHK